MASVRVRNTICWMLEIRKLQTLQTSSHEETSLRDPNLPEFGDNMGVAWHYGIIKRWHPLLHRFLPLLSVQVLIEMNRASRNSQQRCRDLPSHTRRRALQGRPSDPDSDITGNLTVQLSLPVVALWDLRLASPYSNFQNENMTFSVQKQFLLSTSVLHPLDR